MRLPIKQPRAALLLSLPDLSGGLNMRDGLSEVLDNQLTDSKNMWWRDGILKTRPGMENVGTTGRYGFIDEMIPYKTNVSIGKYKLFYYYMTGERKSNSTDYSNVSFTETNFLLKNEYETLNMPSLENKKVNFLCVQNKVLYAFCSCCEIWELEISVKDDGIKFGVWKLVGESNTDIHIPLVATFCNCNGKLTMKPEEVLSSGVAIEGYNILSDYYKIQYNAYNPNADELSSDGKKTGHPMIYGLLKNCNDEKYIGKTVTAKYTDENGTTYEHKVKITNNVVDYEDEPLGDGLRMRIHAQMLGFLKGDTTSFAFITDENDGKNNLEIIAPYVLEESGKQKIFNMTQCEWFGGGATGIAGGTRLFLCGNESEPSLVRWSGLNKPLYFPENAYFHVGDSTSKVMGFGKQSDMLVIFKENETWYTQYQQNVSITAENLINQSVIDYASSAVYFPLVQINSNIGCGYPDTIELCRNRLVWLGTDRRVYTLVSENQYNERSIFCVSEMIEKRLGIEYNIDNAFSADWKGHYLLFVNNHVYVMDYESYGYVYVASHTKTENAQVKIPWWYWELCNKDKYCKYRFNGVISVGTELFVVCYAEEGAGLLNEPLINRLLEEFDKDNFENEEFGEKIPSMLQTKLFDFGVPHVRKNIEQVNLQLGNNGGELIKVTFITESGTDETEVYLDGDETQNYTAGYIDSCAVFPCIKQVLRFGLKLECNGRLATDSVILKYRTTGGAR